VGMTTYRKILVGYDDSEQAKDALALGRRLAGATGAELVVAGVFQFDPIWGGLDPHFHEAEAELTRRIEAAAKSAGAVAEAVPSSSTAHGLHDLAEEIGADLLLVGSAHHGRLGQALAGSVGVALLQAAPCAVGIAPRGYRDADSEITSIAVGYDGSDEARLALAEAAGLAAATGAKLRILTVAEPPPIGYGKGGGQGWHELKEAIEDIMRERLAEAREQVPEGIEVEATLVGGDPSEALAGAAGAPGTLLMVGSRAYGPVRRVLLGSVSTALVRSAPCPLIVTPRGAHVSSAVARDAEVGAAS
jgi:nucleotide-binding universal stress UspA family protein